MTALSPFTTYFGTPIAGFYITWSAPGNTSGDLTQSELIADISWQLYAVGASSGANEPLDATNDPSYEIPWYMTFGFGETADEAKSFDSVKGTLKATMDDGIASADSIVVDWKTPLPGGTTAGTYTGDLEDRCCTDELCATTTADTADWKRTEYSGALAEKMCSEKWVNSENSITCVKIDF